MLHGSSRLSLIRLWLLYSVVGTVALLTVISTARAETERSAVNSLKTPDELARWIDRQFEEAWSSQGVTPAPLTNDSEYVRRVYLDLIGRIPSVAEVREFLTDTRVNKRQVLVEELLQRGSFAAHLANTWRDLLLAGNSALDVRNQAPALETWLKLRFSANMPYDQLASELITATLDQNQNNQRTPSPLAFYQAAEFKPEQLASSVSKVFLGVQVQCAQCHDHPFTAWKQPQFWSFAAFFQGLEPAGAQMMSAAKPDSDQIQIPGKDVLVPAAFLDGSAPDRTTTSDRRQQLARWLTSPSNPYFDKAVVNRVWGNYFGRGFVQPIDDLDPSNPPVFPAVFDEICTQFRLHQCDVKYLVRVITATRAYQLSSRGVSQDGDDGLSQQFARMPLRRMTSDQVFASFVQATGFREPTVARPNGLIQNGARDEFQSKFGDSTVNPTEIETTILQALSQMNGRFVTDATDLEKSELLAAVADSPLFTDRERLEMLFLATLSRSPNASECDLLLVPVDAATTTASERKTALADAFWLLLNSAEFLLNH